MGSKSKNMSIIDKGLTVDGTVSTTGKLIIKGTVKGTLSGDDIVVAEEGAVYADTKASNMTIGGIFEGDVTISKELVILSTGSCSGKVVCKDLVVEAGGILNAEVTCTEKEAKIISTPKKVSVPEKGKKLGIFKS